MGEAKKIIKMIKEVDPADTGKLDEIDARVWCWLIGGYLFSGNIRELNNKLRFRAVNLNGVNVGCEIESKYTRSRDTLKSIRPEGFEFPIDVLSNGAGFIFGYGCPAFNNGKFLAGYNKPLPTEELAELHAIIQAIEYERGK